jgi:hypothetical protein
MDRTVPQSVSEQNTERDLLDAKELLRDAQSRDDGQKYRQAAEIILQKILYRDPSNEQAKSLMAEAHAARSAVSKSRPAPVPSTSAIHLKDGAPSKGAVSLASAADRLGDPPASLPAGKSSASFRIPILVIAGLALAVGVVVFSGDRPEEPPVSVAQPAPEPPVLPEIAQETQAVTEAAPSPHEIDVLSTIPNLAGAVKAALPTPPTPPPVAPAVSKSPAVPVAPAVGNLAVSSPIAADAYLGDNYLGSTPGTFRIPAGKQTVEYRHGDLRNVVTYDVAPNQTITARVTFEIEVRVNARPWAQVYLDGAPRRSLGQTPLSSLKVPVGSVLVFENPNFPAKSHRVTDQDSSIQMVFP